MLNFSRLLQALQSPPDLLLRKAAAKAGSAWRDAWNRRRDGSRSTHGNGESLGPLVPIVGLVPSSVLTSCAEQVRALADHAGAHRFDLLGSGWVEVKHGMHCRGVEGYRYDAGPPVDPDPDGGWLLGRVNSANLVESQRVWRLVSRGYTPIDWQLDFKSGYRWQERTWYRDVPHGHRPGVDIKVPWELSRMQSLPLLALAHILEFPSPSTSHSSTWLREFRDQVLDFVAANPPRFGVNWASTMDVAIRAANLLIAWDLFRAHGASFDRPFEAVFARSITEHGRHIVLNLEWDPGFRGNHYLANLAGLLFCSTYLPRSPETDSWLAFAIEELRREAEHQFLNDGTNFEASTCYHRLSSEMLIYCTALVLGLNEEKKAALREYDYRRWKGAPRLRPGPIPLQSLPGKAGESPFSPTHFQRLEQAVEFTVHLTKPSRRVAQIGDNDSGRWMKLVPPLRRHTVSDARARNGNLEGYAALPDGATYWEEDHLDHRQLVGVLSGLVQRADLAPLVDDSPLDGWLTANLAGNRRVSSYRRTGGPAAAETRGHDRPEALDRLEAQLLGLTGVHRMFATIPMPGRSLRDELAMLAYPDFGMYVFRSARLFLGIRCGPIGQDGLGGHAHNDQLSLEVTVDGEDWISDPGSYLYTPLPARRNQYRSMLSHYGPRFAGGEPGSFALGLFRLGCESVARCLHFSPSGFAGVLQSPTRTTHSIVRVGDQAVTVQYFCVGDRFWAGPEGSDWKSWLPGVPFSPGYGISTRVSADISPPVPLDSPAGAR